MRDDARVETVITRIERPEGYYGFRWAGGSLVWPSDDPADSPCDYAICPLVDCGKEFSAVVWGTFGPGDGPVVRLATLRKQLAAHLRAHAAEVEW